MAVNIAHNLYKKKLRKYVQGHLKRGIDIQEIRNKLINSKIKIELVDEVTRIEDYQAKPLDKKKTLIIISIVSLLLVSLILFVTNLLSSENRIIEDVLTAEELSLSMNLSHQGVEAYRNKDFDLTIRSYEDSLTLNPNQPRTWAELGWAYYEVSRFEDSKEAFSKSIEYSPNKDFGGGLGLGIYYLYNHDYEKANPYFNFSLKTGGNYEQDVKTIAREAMRAGWFEKCVEMNNILIELSDFDQSYGRLGVCFLEMKDMNSARQMFEKELEHDPNSEFGLRGMGIIKYGEGDIVSAKQYLEKSFEGRADPDTYGFHLLGKIYIEERDYDAAESVFNFTLEKYCVHNVYKYDYKSFYESKDIEEAKELLSQIAALRAS